MQIDESERSMVTMLIDAGVGPIHYHLWSPEYLLYKDKQSAHVQKQNI